MKVYIYDTTLRDGAQAFGVNFSVEDKLRILEKLDEFGIDYVEGGWPSSNPKDNVFFSRAKELKLKHTKLTAFGSTRRAGISVDKDPFVEALLKAGTSVITIFGKSWDLHVTHALRTSLEENLNMIRETLSFLRKDVEELIFDAEHFFDGFKRNKEYALKVLESALEGGADWIVLCDTNGGTLPHEVSEIVSEVREKFPEAKIGVHMHNDSETAVANSIMGVLAGATQVHGTINGIGERVGNANLCSIIPNLQIKMGYEVVPEDSMRRLTELAMFVAELSNMSLPRNMPYVGESAFAHKGGVHASAVLRHSETYEHINPELVGNQRRITVSDLSGRSNVIYKLKEFGISVDEKSPEVIKLVEKIKEMESEGYHFETAEASLELLCKKHFGLLKNYFELDAYRVLIAKRSMDEKPVSEATVRLFINEVNEHTAALDSGPVSALDKALKKALVEFYPNLKEVQLLDYKVRIVNESAGTSARVRVLIECTDGRKKWSTIGVSDNIIEASWIALTDSLIYKLMKDEEEIASSG